MSKSRRKRRRAQKKPVAQQDQRKPDCQAATAPPAAIVPQATDEGSLLTQRFLALLEEKKRDEAEQLVTECATPRERILLVALYDMEERYDKLTALSERLQSVCVGVSNFARYLSLVRGRANYFLSADEKSLCIETLEASTISPNAPWMAFLELAKLLPYDDDGLRRKYEILEKGLLRFPSRSPLRCEFACLHRRDNELEKALATLLPLTETADPDPGATWLRAEILFEQTRYQEAATTALQVPQDDSSTELQFLQTVLRAIADNNTTDLSSEELPKYIQNLRLCLDALICVGKHSTSQDQQALKEEMHRIVDVWREQPDPIQFDSSFFEVHGHRVNLNFKAWVERILRSIDFDSLALSDSDRAAIDIILEELHAPYSEPDLPLSILTCADHPRLHSTIAIREMQAGHIKKALDSLIIYTDYRIQNSEEEPFDYLTSLAHECVLPKASQSKAKSLAKQFNKAIDEFSNNPEIDRFLITYYRENLMEWQNKDKDLDKELGDIVLKNLRRCED